MPSQSKSPTSATQSSSGVAPWNSGTESNIFLQDNVFAQCSFASFGVFTQTELLNGAGYGFTIPAGQTITGVAMIVYKRKISLVKVTDLVITINVPGYSAINAADTSTDWPSANTSFVYGSSVDLWGLPAGALTPASVNSGLGASVSAQTVSSTGTVLIDYVGLQVFYTPTPDSPIFPLVVNSPLRKPLTRSCIVVLRPNNVIQRGPMPTTIHNVGAPVQVYRQKYSRNVVATANPMMVPTIAHGPMPTSVHVIGAPVQPARQLFSRNNNTATSPPFTPTVVHNPRFDPRVVNLDYRWYVRD
jgi:hypothetical protein